MKTKTSTKISSHGLALLALLLFGLVPAPGQTSGFRANGKVAFSSERDGIREIYVVDSDSNNQTRLTYNSVVDDHPTWSPDGRKIAFVSEHPAGGFAIYMMNADGTNKTEITRITYSYPWSWSMSWSPDGNRIAFQDNGQIFVINVDGSGRKGLTSDATGGGMPVWSPDGSKILFSRAGTLHTINSDGTNLTPLQSGVTNGSEDAPDWSPIGNKIVYLFDFVDLYIANPDGTGRQFFHGCGWNFECSTPRFSPDGTKIVFVRAFDPNTSQLFVKSLDGTSLYLLTEGRSPSWQPVWSSACPNAVDCPDFFIRQQYRDFLGRDPETSCPPNQCGLDFYLPILNGCAASDVECIKYTRGALSANFFRSPEFQAKGVYVMNLYLVTIGQRPTTVAELQDATKVERPHYAEFTADMAAISSPDDRNGPDPAKKAALTQEFVQRAEIVAKYPTSSYPTLVSFGNALAATAGVTLSSATQSAIAAAATRAQVLQIIAESAEVNAKFYQPTFVTMEYFGYLRRDPEDCHDPANYFGTGDSNGCGFIYQNRRFNELLPQLGSDLTQNFMVRGFIESPEYRGRFGLP